MEKDCVDFVEQVLRLHSSLKTKLTELTEYWSPDAPPVTILFGEIGRQIARDFVGEKTSVKREVFDLVEYGMVNGSTPLVTALATGLIEGAISTVSKDKGSLDSFLCLFGEQSQAHARAWLGI